MKKLLFAIGLSVFSKTDSCINDAVSCRVAYRNNAMP
jgi:hypothetical protein